MHASASVSQLKKFRVLSSCLHACNTLQPGCQVGHICDMGGLCQKIALSVNSSDIWKIGHKCQLGLECIGTFAMVLHARAAVERSE